MQKKLKEKWREILETSVCEKGHPSKWCWWAELLHQNSDGGDGDGGKVTCGGEKSAALKNNEKNNISVAAGRSKCVPNCCCE